MADTRNYGDPDNMTRGELVDKLGELGIPIDGAAHEDQLRATLRRAPLLVAEAERRAAAERGEPTVPVSVDPGPDPAGGTVKQRGEVGTDTSGDVAAAAEADRQAREAATAQAQQAAQQQAQQVQARQANRQRLDSLTVEQLRDEARAKGQPTSGSKAELVDRLAQQQ